MPVIENPKHERFAQALFEGMTQDAAYEWAGFAPDRGHAARLAANGSIQERLSELLATRETRLHRKFEVTKERILAELAKIGFSDIRKAVKWHGALIQEEDNPEGGDTLVIKNTYSNSVQLIDSEKLDDETAAAISEVSQSATGALKIKLYDKKAALVDMGRHLGMFTEKHEVTGKDGAPLIPDGPIDKIDLARRLLHLIAEAAREKKPAETDNAPATPETPAQS